MTLSLLYRKNKNIEKDPFLIPVKTNSITLEYAKEKWEYATYFNRLLLKTNLSTKNVDVFWDILLSIHGETYNLLNDHLLEHLRGSVTNINCGLAAPN